MRASHPSNPIAGRVVLVTGASSGIGRATVVELARRAPATILLTARRAEALEATIELARRSCGEAVRFEAIACDLADPAALQKLAARVRAEYGRLDALVNNAGMGGDLPFEDPGSLDELDDVLQLNLRAPIALAQLLAPLLVESRGTLVNVSSVAGLIGTPQSPVYSATKWGLTGFSEALRARWADLGVRVVCVQPGPVPTPGWPHARLTARPLLGRLLATDVSTVARTIAGAVDGRGGPAPVRPRAFAPIPLLRGVAPWLLRRMLATGARSGSRWTGRGEPEAPR